jgi:hypothetical protein
MANVSWPASTTVTAMGNRDIFLDKAAICRERARSDAAHADYWIEQAINWLQRAAQTDREAVTHEVRDGRMIPKSGRQGRLS